jgi:D-alanyl-D-alanine carboxypeptidase
MKSPTVRNLFQLLTLLLLALVVAIGGHFWISDRNRVLRWCYPAEAWLAKQQIHCSAGAPVWLPELLEHAVDEQFSLANQIAYRAPDGALHHCENGWQGALFRSPVVSAQTRFRYASLSKLLTADAVLARINSGALSLDDRLVGYLSELPPLRDARIADITIDQLLRHRAGFDRLKTQDPMTAHGKRPWCPDRLAELASQRLDFEPGRRFAYANLGYCLLGSVLERLEGKSFPEIMEDDYRIAARGMVYLDGPYLADEVRYDFRNSGFYGPDYHRHFDFPALASSAGLSGNASALAELIGEMLQRKPLNLLSATRSGDCDERRYEGCYGYALIEYRPDWAPLKLYIQGGLLYGAASKAVVDDRGGVTVWLGSGMSPAPRDSSIAFADLLLEKLAFHYGLN